MKHRAFVFGLVIIAVVFAVDQWTKQLAIDGLSNPHRVIEVTPFMRPVPGAGAVGHDFGDGGNYRRLPDLDVADARPVVGHCAGACGWRGGWQPC
jgi:hypothetical protein